MSGLLDRRPDFEDKELQQLVGDAATGRRFADKRVGVHRRDGQPAWVLVHVEVQGAPEAAFAERMFVYNHKSMRRWAARILTAETPDAIFH